MWVVALGADNNAYVVDGVRARLNLSERINVLFELHHKWKPLQVRYEEYGMQADIEAAKAEMERRQYRFRIYPVGGQVSKPDRIRRLIPWFEGGRIWFPREMVRPDERGVLRDIIEDTVQEEYLPFPVGRYDDALDNLARLAEPATAELPGLPWPKAGAQTESPPSPAWAVLDELMGY
jgi:phage terminase large subunit-like protein